MVYIYVRNSDQVVLTVREVQLSSIPEGMTEYNTTWAEKLETTIWSKVKVIRNEDGTYTETTQTHTEESSGVF